MGNSKVTKFITRYFSILILTVLVLSISRSSFDDEIDNNEHYCEMVKIFKDSDGENGWPDYNDNYGVICNDQ